MFNVLSAVSFDGILAWVQNYFLPAANSILVVLGPAVTPWLATKIGSKFLELKALVSDGLLALTKKLTDKMDVLETKVNVLATLPDKIDVKLQPLMTKLDTTQNMIVILAENSRVPDDVKRVLASMRDASSTADTLLASVVSEKDAIIEDLKAKLVIAGAKIAESATEAIVSAVTTKTKKNKSKENKW